MKNNFRSFNENSFAYFDYAATTFMPESVIEKLCSYNRSICVSYGRGKSFLSNIADFSYMNARNNIKAFFTSHKDTEFIFYRGASHAINEIAYSIEHYVGAMDIILIGPYEHHSNYLVWRELSKRKGAVLFEMPLLNNGEINIQYLKEIKDRVKIAAFSSVANTNGYRINIQQIKDVLPEDALIIIDDSQKCAHEKIHACETADCHIVNAHKMYGPKGIAGALVSQRMLEIMKPCMYGGGMIDRVGFPNVWKKGAEAFECGTMDVGAVVAWEEACRYIDEVKFENIREQEKIFYKQVYDILARKSDVTIISTKNTYSLLSFYHNKLHAHDIEEAFSNEKVIVRTGHLCSQNSIAKYGMKPIVRISFGISTDEDDMEALLNAADKIL